jgi:hypothetical protein
VPARIARPSPRDRRALAALQRAVTRTAPDIATALLRAVRILADQLDIPAITRLLDAGNVEGALDAVFTPERLAAALAEPRADILAGIDRAATATVTDLVPRDRRLGIAFDVASPSAIAALRSVEAISIGPYATALRETIRAAVRRGVIAGVNPRETARGLRDLIGMAPNQEVWAANYRAALEAGDYAKALTYRLGDGRYDATLKRLAKDGGALSAEQVDRMAGAYNRRLIAYHSEVVSRQAAVSAHRVGQATGLGQAVDAGLIPGDRLQKTWVHSFASEEPRPEHLALHGETIPFSQPWPVDGGVQVPGENAYGCRCVQTFSLRPRSG